MATKIVKQIAHVCIFAHDLKQTEDFYRDVLGIRTVFNFTRNGEVFGFYLDAGGDTHIEVFHKSESAFSEANQINHLCLEVVNMDEAIAHVKSQGIEVREKSIGCDDTWQSWLSDPNGVKIELFQYTGESAQFVGRDRVAHW